MQKKLKTHLSNFFSNDNRFREAWHVSLEVLVLKDKIPLMFYLFLRPHVHAFLLRQAASVICNLILALVIKSQERNGGDAS